MTQFSTSKLGLSVFFRWGYCCRKLYDIKVKHVWSLYHFSVNGLLDLLRQKWLRLCLQSLLKLKFALLLRIKCFSGWLVWHKVCQPSDVKVERDRWDWGGKESWSWTISDAYSREKEQQIRKWWLFFWMDQILTYTSIVPNQSVKLQIYIF